jgi:hypothetical protein
LTLRVDRRNSFNGQFALLATLRIPKSVQLAVDVAWSHFVVVDQSQTPYSRSRESFDGITPDRPQPNDNDERLLQPQ